MVFSFWVLCQLDAPWWVWCGDIGLWIAFGILKVVFDRLIDRF